MENHHDIRAVDRYLLVNLQSRKLKLINFQEFDVVTTLQTQGASLIPAGILCLDNSNLDIEYHALARTNLRELLSNRCDADAAAVVQHIMPDNTSTFDKLCHWFNIQEVEANKFNPLATALYWAQLINSNHITANVPYPYLIPNSLNLQTCLNIYPACITNRSPPDLSLIQTVLNNWNTATPTLPLIKSANDHYLSNINNLGIYRFDFTYPATLTEWLRAPALLGQLKSHWLSLDFPIPTLPDSTPDHVSTELKKNLLELYLNKGDNVIVTRVALLNVSKSLGAVHIHINNEFWQSISHLSPTI